MRNNSLEYRTLRFVTVFHARRGHFPTIAETCKQLSFRRSVYPPITATSVADMVRASEALDYTVPARGESGWRDDVCNWTVEPVDAGEVWRLLG